MAALNYDKINSLGFASVGKNVSISEHAQFYGTSRIKIGNNVRIDDFCVLSAGEGGIELGDFIHIAVYTSLIGDGKIILENFVNLSSRVSIYSSNDDYSGETMTNPTIPNEYKNVNHSPVIIKRHTIIGSGSVILPGVEIDEGVSIGALSLVNTNCESFGIYAGCPIRKIKNRNKNLLFLEQDFIKKYLK